VRNKKTYTGLQETFWTENVFGVKGEDLIHWKMKEEERGEKSFTLSTIDSHLGRDGV